MSFSTRITVRFADADPAGLVYYAEIFHYCHVAMEEFFAAHCGTAYEVLIGGERLGFPTVNVHTEFLAPLVYGDEALIEVYASDVGESSVTFEYRVYRASDLTLCVRSTQVHAAMNLDTHCAVPIPEKYRQAFASSA